VFHPSQPIREMGYALPNRPYEQLEGYGLSSPDVEGRFGKVALEMNRIMKTGGLVMLATHQTWPLHEVPWDFWPRDRQGSCSYHSTERRT
jgi:hypothetical protein